MLTIASEGQLGRAMSVTAADTSSSFLALSGELQSSLPPSDSFRRQSKALSLSSLSDELQHSVSSKEVASEACRDVERELAAIETRLSVFRGRRRTDGKSTFANAVSADRAKEKVADSLTSSVSSNAADASSPIFSRLSKAQQETGAVADQVATTLMKCDQLLQRAKSCDASRVSSASSTKERTLRAKSKTRKLSSSASRNAELMLSDSYVSSASSPNWDVNNRLGIDDEEALLARKAAAVKNFAARCQRDIETSTTKIELHHQQMQAAYLKELQRKYESKKHMTLMALRERYEAETKALVRAKMEEYEFEEATAVKKTQATLLEDRNRAFQELQYSHNIALEESLSQLELQLTTETEREKHELENQLQEELSLKLRQVQVDSSEALARWETEQRQRLEQELFEHREAAVASVLKTQEERTTELKQQIQSSHSEKEEAELQKLKKALAFGAQAQLQQLRKRLEMEHEEKLNDIKTEASLNLEKETAELKQMLRRSHNEQEEQLQRDLEKKNRVVIMELHDSMQASHQNNLQALKDAAERRLSEGLATRRHDFELECRQELQELERTLDQEMSVKLRQLEMDHAEECELKLEQLRMRAVNQHARELEAKRSRMIQCKNVLLAEATAFLCFGNNDISESSVNSRASRSKANSEDNSAASHLFELKKHLSKELAQYVDVMVAEFDELAEEQRILVAKISESTQLYLSFKRQCGVLEAQSAELTSGLESLHHQLQQKDSVCKKLYQANEVLLKRLQMPALQSSVGGRRALGVVPKSAGAIPVSRRTRNGEAECMPAWDLHGNQARRLSSTNVPSRRVSADRIVVQVFTSTTNHTPSLKVRDCSADHTQHQGHLDERGDSNYEFIEEVQQLRDENATFRHENDLLRTKLVEKMRGQSKVVAGGQFRAASAPSAKVPIAPSVACTKCMIARAKAVKAHHESEKAQVVAAELRKHINNIESVQKRLWEERGSHLSEITQLRDKLSEKVEECVLIGKECTKLDRQIKMLQPQSDDTGTFVNEAVQCTLQQSADEAIKAHQLFEIAALKAEVQHLGQRLDERDQDLNRVSREVEEAQAATAIVKVEREHASRLWLNDSSEYARRILEREHTLESTLLSLQNNERAHQQERKLFEEASQKLLADIRAKDTALEVLEQKHRDDKLAENQKHGTLVYALKTRIAQKGADVDRLHALISQLSAEKVSRIAMQKQAEELKKQVEALVQENSELTNALDQQQQTTKFVQVESNNIIPEPSHLSETLEKALQDNLTLRTRISELEAELLEQVELLHRQRRSHARAMERLVDSSLRLCVVAPTVNVQLNTNGAQLSNKSGVVTTEKELCNEKDLTELVSVTCRVSPHHDIIKKVIENEVLPLFTSVFLQSDDNASPQPDMPMTHWLQELLQDLQSRIAAQLESIYSTATKNSRG
ncbi:unnamed protein product [Phytophthora fragariaefolia]|uniref:Unnamed protein product n=1 Tax=Phytophthora fragariaefolia TaxID=1490495 RepID=A0A9W6XLR8_9STRA|nr:unnamed protein product [Phytophthora fragariaefolia]